MSSVLDVNANDWEKEILKPDTLVVVDFWHKNCLWCLRLDPIYNEVSEEYKGRVIFAKLNVLESHDNQHIAIKYGIMSTPTLVFFCKGIPVETVVGFQPKDRLKQLVDEMTEKHQECVEKSTVLPQ